MSIVERTSKSRLAAFDTLTVGESRRLLSMLALEEAGLPPSGRDDCHCCHRTHKHKRGGNTASLAVKPRRKPAEDDPNPDESQVGRLHCRGSCGYEHLVEAEARRRRTQPWKINALSFYLEGVSPDPSKPESWKDFWTEDKISSVISHLRKREKFSLGWLSHKKSRGVEPHPNAKEADDIAHTDRVGGNNPQKSPNGFLAEWVEIFGDALEVYDKNPVIGKTVASARGWKPDVLRSLIKDGLIAIKPSERHEGDFVLSFAYRGLVPGPPGLPCRLIKTRHLFATPETDAFSRRTIHPGAFSALLGDFTAATEIIQNVNRLVFVEGEPDAISWRHIFPQDGVVCVGDVNEYKPILECLPSLNLKGKEVIYVQDRDQDAQGNPKITEAGLGSHHEILRSIAEQEPKTVKLWICPQVKGAIMKDPNDFLKRHPRPTEILSFSKEIHSSDTKLSLPVYKKAFDTLFEQHLRS